MSRKVSEKLIRNLSLYLDNQLPEEEMIEIEELLKIDQEVSEIFDSLKRTRLVLRNAPRIKRRKSFTLSQEYARQVKRESGWMNGMRLVSTFSMILLLVVFTQNMLGGWSPLENIYMGANNSTEDSVEMENMEFYSQDADVEKMAVVDDAVEEESVDRDAATTEVGEADVEDCNVEETCVEPTAADDADESLEEGESSLAPEDVIDGEEDIQTEEESSEEGLDTVEDAADAETEESITIDEEESTEEAEGTIVAELDGVEETEVELEGETGKSMNLILQNVLLVITVLSIGTYLFLRKKFS